MTNFNFTALENTIVEKLVNMAKPREERDDKIGEYSFFDMGVFEDGIWADCLVDECGDYRVYRGVLSSLIKKGFFSHSYISDGQAGHWVELTENGGKTVAEMAGVEYINRWI